MPSIVECQKLVWELEEQKGFGHDLDDKLFWILEELGEVAHAFKHGDVNKLAVEATDITFFTATSLESLKQNGDRLALNVNRAIIPHKPVVYYIRELAKTYGLILTAADQLKGLNEFEPNPVMEEVSVDHLSWLIVKMHLTARQLIRTIGHDPDVEFLKKLEKNRTRIPIVHGNVRHFDRE